MTVEAYRPLVTVHLAWHPDCSVGTPLGEALFTALFENVQDLTTHGMRIPVRLWPGTGNGPSAIPPAIAELDGTEYSLVILLVDHHAVGAEGWQDFIDELAGRCRATHTFLPVALTPSALQLSGPTHGLNWIRAVDGPLDTRIRRVLNRVAHTLLMHLEREPLTVFLSHAKADGEQVAKDVRSFLHDGTGIRDWFDTQDLAPGSRWEGEIRGAARRNLLLAVRSEAFATREWCRIEVLEAKRAGSPVAVLDVLDTQEDRSFPYLGNGPAMRWTGGDRDAGMERLLTMILLEALRFSYFPRRVAQLRRLYGMTEPVRVHARPPELLTMVDLLSQGSQEPVLLVYPDPPLGAEELSLLTRMAPSVTPATPTQLLTRG